MTELSKRDQSERMRYEARRICVVCFTDYPYPETDEGWTKVDLRPTAAGGSELYWRCPACTEAGL